VLKASMSSSSFDAVVPDILTFRPDKDDPLDVSGDQHVSSREEVTTITIKQKFEELREKRMELITAVVSTIASWNINEAFEEVCCKSLKLSKGISQNISYGLKGYS
jgi:hypothetical protein